MKGLIGYFIGVIFGIIITLFLMGKLNLCDPCEPCTTDQCHDKIEQEQKAINFNTFG
jgi:ABC-type antimicrobial peptide transport system permease subunit